MSFQANTPSNVAGNVTTESNPLRDLFSEALSFGEQILPIDDNPGAGYSGNAPLTEEDEPSWVTEPPSNEVTPAASAPAAIGANCKWFPYNGGILAVNLPNGADIRSVFFQDAIDSPVTISSGAGGGNVVCIRDNAGTVPIPPGNTVISLTMTPSAETMWVFISGDILPPFESGAGAGDLIYIQPQPSAPGEAALYQNMTGFIQLVSVGGIVAQAYINGAKVSGGSPAMYALNPGDTLQLIWGYDLTVETFSNVLHYFPMSDTPPAPSGSIPTNLFAADESGLSIPNTPLYNVVTDAGPMISSQRGGPPLTGDGASSAFLNARAATSGTYAYPANSGVSTENAGDWPITPSGSFTVCFWCEITEAMALVQNSEPSNDFSPFSHPLVGDLGQRPSIPNSGNALSNGFSIYYAYDPSTTKTGIFASLRDTSQNTNPPGYGGAIAGGYYWRTVPAMDDFTSTAIEYGTPFFVCLTYNATTKQMTLQIGIDGEFNVPQSSQAAITPDFFNGGIFVGRDLTEDSGAICYMSKLLICDGVLSPDTLNELLLQGTDSVNPVFQFFKVA